MQVVFLLVEIDPSKTPLPRPETQPLAPHLSKERVGDESYVHLVGTRIGAGIGPAYPQPNPGLFGTHLVFRV